MLAEIIGRPVAYLPVFGSALKHRLGLGDLRDEAVGVLLGVARPERVLESLPARSVLRALRADHHEWTDAEVHALAEEARSKGAKALLTTGKDAVKMTSARPALPIHVLGVETEILDEETFSSLLAVVRKP